MEVALIVAGGSGTRMQSNSPKQFLKLAGRPILMHTIESFHSYSDSLSIILVLPESWVDEWQKLTQEYQFKIKHKVVAGGASRTESVRNGLGQISDDDVVAIHDGVRPFASKNVISHAFQTATKFGNAVVSVRLKESIRKLGKEGISQAVDREDYRIIQTPQVFRGSVIKSAYQKASNIKDEFTDDASLAEHFGQTIHLIEGDYMNMKITTPEDMAIAESILRIRKF